MASKLTLLSKAHHTLFPKPLLRSISTSPFLSQQQQPLLEDPSPIPTPLPPNPSTGSPFYTQNWRNPNPNTQTLIPATQTSSRMFAFSQTLDTPGLMNAFADLMTRQQWGDLKQLFEFWIRSLDGAGKPNKPDVGLYNCYLRAEMMNGLTTGELLDLVAQMDEFGIAPNTATYNLVLKAMFQANDDAAAVLLLDRMMQTGTLPDDESYNLIVGLLLKGNQIDLALKHLDLTLKSGYMVSSSVFKDFVRSCVTAGRLDSLSSIIEKCKKSDQNKALCPPWNLCSYIADVALQVDHSQLTFFALEFLNRWIIRGENARPPILLSVDEGLVLSALGTASRAYDSTLIDASWLILRRSLRQKRAPNPETYISKINAYASLGNLERAFSTLKEFETVYNSSGDIDAELFSPFTSLHPLVVACCKDGFTTLDSVYVQMEKLSNDDPPYKSVAALNCIILGCANIWDIDRAYETFEAISEKMGLTPDIHSYNALLSAFGKLRKTSEASKVCEHLVSLGLKPNATTYSLLVEAHLVNRDSKTALSVIDEMVIAGFTPTKDILRKVRRRCSRELDFDSDERVQSLAQKFNYRLGGEGRKEMLYRLEYSAEY